MAQFITRVELHGASGEDYSRLHAAMTARKFHRFITADDGQRYQLPTAEYYSHGEITKETVRDLASSAAESTRRPFWVLVTEYKSAAWRLPLYNALSAALA